MNFTCRAVTTSRPIITRSLWNEVRSRYLFEIIDLTLKHNIPDELIINADQTPSKFVATDNVTMATKGEKHISRAGQQINKLLQSHSVKRWMARFSLSS